MCMCAVVCACVEYVCICVCMCCVCAVACVYSCGMCAVCGFGCGVLCPRSLDRGSGWEYSTTEHQEGGFLSAVQWVGVGPWLWRCHSWYLMNVMGVSVLGRLDQTEGLIHLVTLMCSFEPPDACLWVFPILTGPRILSFLWDGRRESGALGHKV